MLIYISINSLPASGFPSEWSDFLSEWRNGVHNVPRRRENLFPSASCLESATLVRAVSLRQFFAIHSRCRLPFMLACMETGRYVASLKEEVSDHKGISDES
jgi:hypothetical protein